MKKLILALLFVSISHAQSTYASLTADVRNITVGSGATNNKPELDILLRFGVIGTAGVGKNVKVGVVLEKFKAIEFNKYAAEVGYDLGNLNLHGELLISNVKIIDFSKFDFQFSFEAGWIERYKINFWCVGANVDLIYQINDHFGAVVTNNLLSRTDLNAKYGGKNWKFSNYAGIIYRF